jgi:hypothetical protein
MTLIKMPGESLFDGHAYLGEGLKPSATDFFAAVGRDDIGNFLFDHPEYLNKAT